MPKPSSVETTPVSEIDPRPRAVPARPLGELVASLEQVRILGPEANRTLAISGFTMDSRAVRPGDLYAAVPGASVHGAQFAADAARLGAVAVLTDEQGAKTAVDSGLPLVVVPEVRPVLGRIGAALYGHPAEAMTMLGITGTNGKTTTSFLMEGGLRAAGLHSGIIGTTGTRVGDQAVKSVRTTPEAPDLQALLEAMRRDSVEAVAMEVSSHALAYGRTAGIRYKVAAFTNLTQDHLDFHADFEDYFEAKAKLFTPGYTALAVVNTDDPYGRRIAERAASLGVRVWTISPSGAADADWRAENTDLGPDGSGFDLVGPDGTRRRAGVRLPGAFNVANALTAVVSLIGAGVDPEAAVAGVAGVAGVPGRIQPIDAGQDFLAIVDYAHTPDAISTLLASLRPVTRGRLRIVVGCGGDRDRAKRPLMGAAAARGADEVVLTNDNPRSEDPLQILAAAEAGARDAVAAGASAEVEVCADRAEAIARAVGRSEPGDTVVVAGKGHEQGQEIAGVIHPFDDAAVLRAAIQHAAARPEVTG
ncbi:UDP-N-acetylmuramoyl-L-alanyl-D-glutamate--2,6-diaminopimelate ligase [Actinospica acidithermotolerans]|uniref:UDP-N-acetylmuramoyl-L-alanyl-D-glutamate--2, 6-diaminopimelate ligase n=1 Tax=Actinospica acidithermotolerans TaxID=2828514 RepID=UPI0027DDEBCD|nr:UDP-N-acetylmuramoyl-L-alanyl-D-glutamate--2,6-diaminopimelate ligase [Actinospica acidithermotolerans]